MQQSDLTGFNWFLGSAWKYPEALPRLLTQENWRQSLQICVPRLCLGTRIICYKPLEL